MTRNEIGRRLEVRALLLGVGVSAALVAVAEWQILPRTLPLPRAVWLMGFAASDPDLVDVPINSLGFTGDDPRAVKPAETLRVLTLGGSVLFNRNFTERLRRELEPYVESELEVLGAALRGHTSRSSLLKWNLLRDRKWDVVVVYAAINDLWANHYAPADYREDYGHLSPWYVRNPLLDRSILARLFYNRFLYREPQRELMASGYRSINTFARNLHELVASIRAEGARPVLSTFAWMIPEDYDRAKLLNGEMDYVNPDRYDQCGAETWGPVEWVREGLRRSNAAIRTVSRDTETPLFDARNVLGDEARWFGDVCHPSEQGAQRLSRALAESLDALGVLRAPGESEAEPSS